MQEWSNREINGVLSESAPLYFTPELAPQKAVIELEKKAILVLLALIFLVVIISSSFSDPPPEPEKVEEETITYFKMDNTIKIDHEAFKPSTISNATDSMYPLIKGGDVVYYAPIDSLSLLEPGDIVVFEYKQLEPGQGGCTEDNTWSVVYCDHSGYRDSIREKWDYKWLVHAVVGVAPQNCVVTHGINNADNDQTCIALEEIIGRVKIIEFGD